MTHSKQSSTQPPLHATAHTAIGLGSEQSQIKPYTANRPQLDHYPQLLTAHNLKLGETAYIAANTSNHWRKLFNAYAKLILIGTNVKQHMCFHRAGKPIATNTYYKRKQQKH